MSKESDPDPQKGKRDTGFRETEFEEQQDDEVVDQDRNSDEFEAVQDDFQQFDEEEELRLLNLALDVESSSTTSVDSFGSAEEEVTAMSKLQISLDPYHGLDAGAALPGGREELAAKSWCSRVEQIARSAGWNEKQTLANAKLAIVPRTPAGYWLEVNEADPKLDTWGDFKDAIIATFGPKSSVIELVNCFKTMKQLPKERVRDYLNKIHLKIKFFEDSLGQVFAGGEYAAETPEELAVRKKVTATLLKHLTTVMFTAGLQEDFIVDITKGGSWKLDEIVQVACKTESASAAVQSRKKIAAAIDAENPEQMSLKKLEAQIAALSAKWDKNGTAKDNEKKEKESKTDKSKLTCYYCFKPGHRSTKCKTRDEDRAAGTWRVHVDANNIGEAAFKKLSREERNVGAEALKKRQARTSQGATGGSSSGVVSGGITAEPSDLFWSQYHSLQNQGN